MRYVILFCAIIYFCSCLGLYVHFKHQPYKNRPVDPDLMIGLLSFLFVFVLCFIYAEEREREKDNTRFVRQVNVEV